MAVPGAGYRTSGVGVPRYSMSSPNGTPALNPGGAAAAGANLRSASSFPRPSSGSGPGMQRQYGSPANGAAVVATPVVPPGTLPPGTIVRVGEYQVRVERFLSEGGFAHVYLATSSTPIPAHSPHATTKHVLKRIAVPDTKGVEEVGKEVEVMKLLRNHPRIVNLIEASVSELAGGVDGSKGYEVYILMEWCAGGGIIDMMNTRLQNRLTESEILKVFSDTVEAVAHMHYQSPPLIHRDLKVENILLSPPQTYKLCDFGSTCKPIPREKVPTAVEALQKMELEINKTTTLQYRAPEIVDIWSRKGFDEKIDIWALGVLLYKLCYYTTPFEEHGPLAILNAQYTIPPYPAYSNNIKGLIQGMLQESAARRPNIYQVHEQVCKLRGTSVKIENKYAAQATPLVGNEPSSAYSDILSSGPAATQPNSSLASASLAETISPMRRGRPAKTPLGSSTPPVNPESPARLVRTGGTVAQGHEWQSMSSNANGTGAWPTGKSAPSTGSNGFGDDFRGISSSTLANDVQSKSPAAFGDSFDPSALAVASKETSNGDIDPDKVAFEGKFPSLDDFPGDTFKLGTSSTASAGVERPPVDVDRTRHASALSPEPGTAGQHFKSGAFNSTSSIQSAAPASSPPFQVRRLSGERASPGPTLPRRPVSQSGNTASLSSISTEAGQLPRRKTSSKPELVSRASQTSPHLLAGYRLPGVGSGTTTTATWQMPSTLHQSSTTPYLVKSPQHAHEQLPRGRVALPGLTAQQPQQQQPTSTTSSSTASSWSQPRASETNDITRQDMEPVSTQSAVVKQPAVDLLGDDSDNEDAFAPRRPVSSHAAPAMSTLPPLTQPVAATIEPVSSSDLMKPAVPSGLGLVQDRERFRPVRPTSPSVTAGPAPDDAPGSEIEERFPSLEALEIRSPSPLPSTGQQLSQPARHLTGEPDDRSGTTQEVDSSDDEAIVEDFAPRRISRSRDRIESPRPNSAQIFTDDRNERGPAPMRLDSIDSVEGGGDIDLGPALSSIQRFAPQSKPESRPQNLTSPKLSPTSATGSKPLPPPKDRQQLSRTLSSRSKSTGGLGKSSDAISPPPLLAPKPQSFKQQAQISSLAKSRFEGGNDAHSNQNQGGLGPETISPVVGDSKRNSTGPPPPTSAKPSSLRRGDSINRGVSGPGSTNDQSKARNRPQWGTHSKGGKNSGSGSGSVVVPASPPPPQQQQQQQQPRSNLAHHHTSTPPPPPPSSATRAPFKPVGPPLTPNGTRPRASVLPSAQPGSGSGFTGADVGEEEEEEEEQHRFAGVSNMKSRWEQITRAQAQEAGSKGPGQPRGGTRKEWAAV